MVDKLRRGNVSVVAETVISEEENDSRRELETLNRFELDTSLALPKQSICTQVEVG